MEQAFSSANIMLGSVIAISAGAKIDRMTPRDRRDAAE
jgi:hypothetical protein